MTTIVKDRLFNVSKSANIDEKYGPYASELDANTKLSSQGAITVGLTVGITQSDGSIKEYWYQPDGQGGLELVKKQAESSLAVSITYAALKALRDGGNLVPGTWYRITDYHTTVSPLITNARSADHQFDVIVRADDASHLNENGYAAHHEGDEYFANCNLEVWELQYRLDNEKWSMAAGTFIEVEDIRRGIMRKLGTVEINGETYILWDASGLSYGYITRAVSEDDEIGTKLYDYVPETGDIGMLWESSIASKFDTEEGQGTILMMKDEYGNQFPYDFKNIQFKRWAVTDSQQGRTGLESKYMCGSTAPRNISIKGDDNFIWAYTFSSDANGGEQTDYSLDSTYNVTNNVYVITNPVSYLLDNVFYGRDNYGNRFELGCKGNTFGNNCQYNSFGNNCQYNSFGDYYTNNSFERDCNNNSFGYSCGSNIFGNGCQQNSFGNGCQQNSFGNGCQQNSFGNSCLRNIFMNYCMSNIFGSSCVGNIFGNYCMSNIFGNYCSNNSFGNGCQNNSFGNYCQSITVFDSVTNCSVTGGSSGSAPVKNAQILNGTAGASAQNKLTIAFDANKAYTQVAAKNTDGNLKIWNPADLVQ